MIIRISGDGQYRVENSVLDEINTVDADLEDAMQASDEARFGSDLSRLLALVRDTGERLDADHLAPSDLILPPDDIAVAEITRELATDSLIPA